MTKREAEDEFTYYPEVHESDKNVSLKAMFREKKKKRKNLTKSNNKSI